MPISWEDISTCPACYYAQLGIKALSDMRQSLDMRLFFSTLEWRSALIHVASKDVSSVALEDPRAICYTRWYRPRIAAASVRTLYITSTMREASHTMPICCCRDAQPIRSFTHVPIHIRVELPLRLVTSPDATCTRT